MRLPVTGFVSDGQKRRRLSPPKIINPLTPLESNKLKAKIEEIYRPMS
jgi:hypothetical protein